MKQLLCLILATLMFVSITACNVTQGSTLPGDTPNNPDVSVPTPPDEFAPPLMMTILMLLSAATPAKRILPKTILPRITLR